MYPNLRDVACLLQHNIVMVSIKKENEWDARSLLHYIGALLPLSKFTIVVDDDIDVNNFDECVKSGKIELDKRVKEVPKQEPKKSDNKGKK